MTSTSNASPPATAEAGPDSAPVPDPTSATPVVPRPGIETRGLVAAADTESPDEVMVAELPDQTAALERALAGFERRRAQLLNADGQPIYSQQEHARREGALAADAIAAVAQAEDAARTALEKAKRDLILLEADPADALSRQELEEAGLRARFVEEDVAALRPTTLRDRAQAVLEGGSKSQCFLHYRAIGRRLEAVDEQQRAGGRLDVAPDEVRAWGELPALVEALAARVRGDRNGARQAAQRRQRAANWLLYRADGVRGRLDGRAAQAEQDTLTRVRRAWG